MTLATREAWKSVNRRQEIGFAGMPHTRAWADIERKRAWRRNWINYAQ
jgi:hypothetical protein